MSAEPAPWTARPVSSTPGPQETNRPGSGSVCGHCCIKHRGLGPAGR
jgi:hypothetical protein